MTGLSFAFTDEQEQFRQAVARFARERGAPGYPERCASGTQPTGLHRELASLGVLGIGLPEKFGGSGEEDPVTLGIACEELGAADVNLAAAPVVAGLTGAQLAVGGTASAQERWLPGLIDGTEVVAIGLTEPEAGSDAAAMRTTATPVPGGWRISGQKNSVSHLHVADATLVYARQPGTAGSAGVRAFLVEAGRDGVSTGSFTDMGQGPIGRGTLYLEDVFVPAENLVGTEGRGFALVMSHFDYSRAAVGLQCLCAAPGNLSQTYAYVRERRAFGKPIAAFQGVS